MKTRLAVAALGVLWIGACSLANKTVDPMNRSTSSSDSSSSSGGSGGAGTGGMAACPGPLTTLTDCGSCGNACKPAHADGATCATGKCDYKSCAMGFQDCDGKRDNGCESDGTTDVQNCGKCMNACSTTVKNAEANCKDGKCGYGKCTGLFGDCDNDPSNGCEQSLETVDNCNGCKTACAPKNTMTPTCTGGMCGHMDCAGTFQDCDMDAAINGCESDKMTDNNNCGMCGKMCLPMKESCAGGKCVAAVCTPPGVEKSVSPGGTEKVCDDPNDTTCEQDQAKLCPNGWHLCSIAEHFARNNGWTYPINGAQVVVGTIYCRAGGGAGHYTLGPYGGTTLGDDVPFNCGFGSSRPECTAPYGCNEKFVQALCCAPSPLCGNAKIDSVEEECDDGNTNEADACLNNCSLRQHPNCN